MVDCSRALSYVTERNRMCRITKRGQNSCEGCGLEGMFCLTDITQKHIDIVQKWSDEHPFETRLDRFLELFPDVVMDTEGTPESICVKAIGWAKECDETLSCEECWNRPYTEKEKNNG